MSLSGRSGQPWYRTPNSAAVYCVAIGSIQIAPAANLIVTSDSPLIAGDDRLMLARCVESTRVVSQVEL